MTNKTTQRLEMTQKQRKKHNKTTLLRDTRESQNTRF